MQRETFIDEFNGHITVAEIEALLLSMNSFYYGRSYYLSCSADTNEFDLVEVVTCH